MNEYLFAFFTALTGSGVTWFFARRKNRAEAQGNEIDNVEKALRVYRDMLTDLKTQIDSQSATIDKQAAEILKLRKEINELKRQKQC